MDGWTGNSLIMWYRAQQTHIWSKTSSSSPIRFLISSQTFSFPPFVWEFFRVGQKCQQWESHHLLRFWDLFTLGIRKSFELLFLGARVEQSQSCATFLCVNIENSQLLIYCIYLILTLVRFNLKFRKTACVIDAQTCRHKRRSSPISFVEKRKVNQIHDGATFQSGEFWTESCFFFFFSTFGSVWTNLNLIKLDAL